MSRAAHFREGFDSARQADIGKAEYNERWAARDPEHAAAHLHAAEVFRSRS